MIALVILAALAAQPTMVMVEARMLFAPMAPPGTTQVVPATGVTPPITYDGKTAGVSTPAGGGSVSVGGTSMGGGGVGGSASYATPNRDGGTTTYGASTNGKSVEVGVTKTIG